MTPGTPLAGDLAPRPGETAEAYAGRLRVAGVEVQRTADAQRAMHAATQRVSDLQKRLDTIIGRPPAGPAPAAPAAPGTPAAAGPYATPAPAPAPPAPLGAPGLEATAKASFAKYSNPNLSEEAAYTQFFTDTVEAAKQLMLTELRSNPKLKQEIREDNYAYTTGRAREAAKAERAGAEIEKFWQEIAPHVPTELLWGYAEQAARTHPDDHAKQVLFCLERGFEAMDKVSGHLAQATHTNDALRRGQEAALPAGGGTPPAPPSAKPPSMIEQMRAARASQPGA